MIMGMCVVCGSVCMYVCVSVCMYVCVVCVYVDQLSFIAYGCAIIVGQ